MIVRVQGSGQYRLDDSARLALESIDAALIAAVGRGDAAQTHTLLNQAIDLVQSQGVALAPTDLASSDLILPPMGSSLEETDAFLRDEGLLA